MVLDPSPPPLLFPEVWDSKRLIEWKSDSWKIVRGLFENVSFEKRPRILGPFPEWWDSKPSSERKSFSEKRIHNNPPRLLFIKRFIWKETQIFWVSILISILMTISSLIFPGTGWIEYAHSTQFALNVQILFSSHWMCRFYSVGTFYRMCTFQNVHILNRMCIFSANWVECAHSKMCERNRMCTF